MPKIMCDVLFVTEDFVLVTTLETEFSPDQRDIEKVALEKFRLTYGEEWVAGLKANIKKVSIEVVPGTSGDEFNKPEHPRETLGGE